MTQKVALLTLETETLDEELGKVNYFDFFDVDNHFFKAWKR